MFGQPVTLNFDRQGAVHRTYCGATVSLALNIFMLWFLIVKVDIFKNKSQNQINIERKPTDFEALGTVNLADTHIMPIMSVYKADGSAIKDFNKHFTLRALAMELSND